MDFFGFYKILPIVHSFTNTYTVSHSIFSDTTRNLDLEHYINMFDDFFFYKKVGLEQNILIISLIKNYCRVRLKEYV